MGLQCTKTLVPVRFAVPLTVSLERTELSPSEVQSELSASGSLSVSENKPKECSKKNKDLSPAGGKKTSIFSSFGHKLTKSKLKVIPSVHVPSVDVSTSSSVEDGFVVVQQAPNDESIQGKPGSN